MKTMHSMFGSWVWFSGSVDRMVLFPVLSNPRWRLFLQTFAAFNLRIDKEFTAASRGFPFLSLKQQFFALVHYQ